MDGDSIETRLYIGREWLAPVLVALATFLTFLPVLQNDFVINYDDKRLLFDNPHWRGLGWTQIQWMFTTLYAEHYHPLTWLSWGLDYILWGMEPFGYHLTNLAVHTAGAVVFYFVACRLLALAIPNGENPWRLTIAAAFAALLFSIHPMQVESVAWPTARRDLLAGFFFLLTIWFYLRANSESGSSRRRWIVAALGVYLLSLLSKAMALTLPAVLLILDWYPLRRLRWQVLWEKIPFALVALSFALIALHTREELPAWDIYRLDWRVGQALYSAGFYIWKTFVPWSEPPTLFNLWAPSPMAILLICLTSVLAVSFYLLRSRYPAGLACWLYMVMILSPILGLIRPAQFFVADRYAYVACLSWALLAAGMLCHFLQASVKTRKDKRRLKARGQATGSLKSVAIGAAILVLTVLAPLTWMRTHVWRDPVALWMHLLRPGSPEEFANASIIGGHIYSHPYEILGTSLWEKGRYTEAVLYMREAARFSRESRPYNNLGVMFAQTGDFEAAQKQFQMALEIDPQDSDALSNMKNLLARPTWEKLLKGARQ